MRYRAIRASPTQWPVILVTGQHARFWYFKANMLNVPLNDHTDISSRATGLNFGPVFIYIHTLCIQAVNALAKCTFAQAFAHARLNLYCSYAIHTKILCAGWQKPNKMDSKAVVRSGGLHVCGIYILHYF